ncbi:OmpA family protein [Flavobacterium aquidurense]|uniref:Outer membrane protein, peptidoglycan-associated lipoprotein n=1 Tax=Flavobacterium aquidurense TaxID=362413 RepID=A0A0Q0XV04_9FLAO|nr:OmpA family protein [Flavobacterium aquidurense]KQB40118.1 Outer membrane protein, peptidoglycan-associated lipoprotein [Flavobacterium aquidurense]
MKKYFLIWIVLFGMHSSYSQTKLVNKAEKEFDQKAYASVNAGNLYEVLREKEFSSSAVYAMLGDSYYFNGDYKNALKAYDYIGKLKDEYSFTNDQLFRYGQSLKSSGRYDDASKIIKQLNSKIGKESLNSGTDYLKNIQKESSRYSIKLVKANSKLPDYGAAFYKEDQVIFTSARDTNVTAKYKDRWSGKPYFKLYEATITPEGDLINPKKLTGKINSVFHQSTPVITNDGTQMYFTRSNFLGNKFGEDDTKTNRLRIYRATMVNGVWDKIEDLSINSDSYSNAHPALRPDGKSMIFASDRPGSLGQTDLYEVELKSDGTFGEVKNMGSSINTYGRETFPFVTKSGQLYFSSDGQPGLGGLDVFAAVEKENGYWIVNVGEPINSRDDDFAFVINSDNKKGFFSSNRTKDDQIYSLKELEPVKEIKHEFTVIGKIVDSITDDALPKVEITAYDENNKEVGKYFTDNAGEFILKLPEGGPYTLKYSKDGYLVAEDIVPKSIENSLVSLNKGLKVDPNADKFIVDGDKSLSDNDDLTKKLGLLPIYFDLNGTKIKKVSLKEMNKVVQVLKDYPTFTIDVRSHTDSQGSSAYNLKLSERRAQATVQYIKSKGIRANRITGKGFGESELLNRCTDGVKCSDKEHQVNRRSEFIIHSNNKK